MALYDRIGPHYDATRQADPRLVDLFANHLKLNSRGCYLDLACGSANYTTALARQTGARFVALDRSWTMLAQAAAKAPGAGIALLQGDAGRLPFANASFDAVLSSLAVHHFPDPLAAYAEVRRVLKPAATYLIFTATAEQTQAYWLSHYFPAALVRSASQLDNEAVLRSRLAAAGFADVTVIPWFVPADLSDLFLYAGKHRPELYFDADVRAGISTFANLTEDEELETGLSRLEADLASGAFADVAAQYDDRLGDYCLVTAR